MKKLFWIFTAFIFILSPVFSKEIVKFNNDEAGVYVFKINTKKYGDKIKPYITPRLTTTGKLYQQDCFELVVNGGFFDVQNGKTVSYVTIDNKMVGDVKEYKELTNNLEKEKRLDKVLSRAELRILEKKGLFKDKLLFDIAYHNEEIKKGYTLRHALQAGPMLSPTMDLEAEGFVQYDDEKNVVFQSVDILKRRERTAIGLKGDELYIVIFTHNHKVDAKEMKDYMTEKLKLKKILALDGGLSTSINYKDIAIGSLGKYQRRVKSFLVVEK